VAGRPRRIPSKQFQRLRINLGKSGFPKWKIPRSRTSNVNVTIVVEKEKVRVRVKKGGDGEET
jgi:hypothetical protein